MTEINMDALNHRVAALRFGETEMHERTIIMCCNAYQHLKLQPSMFIPQPRIANSMITLGVIKAAGYSWFSQTTQALTQGATNFRFMLHQRQTHEIWCDVSSGFIVFLILRIGQHLFFYRKRTTNLNEFELIDIQFHG